MKPIFLDKRFQISVLSMLVMLAVFWLGSRYPALNEKALMGTRNELSGLAFDVLVEVVPGANTFFTILANTVNWLYTNWKGMSFGVIFGAGLLTTLGIMPTQKTPDGYFLGAFKGAVLGAPLGVCVNCAAPIAQGMHAAGMRREMTLATLIASPSLNVVVVTMSFALLPIHLAVIKLIAVGLVILLIIPLMVKVLDRFLPYQAGDDLSAMKNNNLLSRTISEEVYQQDVFASQQNDYAYAIKWFATKFARNFWTLFKITVPLMFLAGFLGAAIITLLPISSILDFVSVTDGRLGALASLALIAAFALFLPVPIAFDVVLVSVLVASGWQDKYAMAALLGLGTFSVYSYIIVGRAMSFWVASSMTAALMCTAIFAGVVANKAKPYVQHHRWEQVDAILRTAPPRVDLWPSMHDAELLQDGTRPDIIEFETIERAIAHNGAGNVSVSRSLLIPQNMRDTNVAFTRLLGPEIGLDLVHLNGPLKQVEPFSYFGGIAAGDVNDDGWDDVAMGAMPETGGLALYLNVGGQFHRQYVPMRELDRAFVNAVAFVDLNNDRALDLFVSTFGAGAHILWNINGAFDKANSTELPNGDALMVGAPAFADLDLDGDMDIIAANWVGATAIGFQADYRATDRILWNDADGFRSMELPGVPGESLSTLVTDINGDGQLDIVIGDDGLNSDKVYLNVAHQRYRLLTKSEGVLPYLGQATMSLDSGDYNNDGLQDIYLSQITQANTGYDQTYCSGEMQQLHGELENCAAIQTDRRRLFGASNPAVPNCALLQDPQIRTICAMFTNIRRSAAQDKQLDCNSFPTGWPTMQNFCNLVLPARLMTAESVLEDDALRDPLGFLADRSLLFSATEAGTYVDVATETNSDRPGWSWNAKFTDLDQDGWQDLFVATGFVSKPPYEANAFYRNTGGAGFEYRSPEFGLADAIPSSAYSLLDFDRDGDVDVIRAPVTAGVIVHRNDRPTGEGLWVELNDGIGNTYGIGSRVMIETSSSQQIRDIKASGGFISFDPIKAHFGIALGDMVERIVVVWPDGARTSIEGPFEGNSELLIRRE